MGFEKELHTLGYFEEFFKLVFENLVEIFFEEKEDADCVGLVFVTST